jgi:hypothetical protein
MLRIFIFLFSSSPTITQSTAIDTYHVVCFLLTAHSYVLSTVLVFLRLRVIMAYASLVTSSIVSVERIISTQNQIQGPLLLLHNSERPRY